GAGKVSKDLLGGLRGPPPQKESVPARSRTTSLRWVAYGCGFVALAIGIFFFGVYRRHKGNSHTAITSVAVLPLEYISTEAGQEYLADGVTDELITQLAKTGAFRVTSRTSSMHFKKTNKSLQEIAGELGVEALLEGSIERAGDRVRIRAQLIRA